MKLKRYLNEMSMDKIHAEIKEFLKKNPKPGDDEIYDIIKIG